MLTTPEIILSSLINNNEFSYRVLPFLKPEYFDKKEERTLFEAISKYTGTYNKVPTVEALFINLGKDEYKLNEKEAEVVENTLKTVGKKADQNIDWLIDTAEKFCQERALHNALLESISIFEGANKSMTRGAIPDILKDALSVSFDTALGHDFIENAEDRFEYYHRKESKVPFDIDYLNQITKGGFSKKTLNIWMAGTYVGKTAKMCHDAGANLKDGKRVLYFTLEISEEEISKRIDANLMNVTFDELAVLSKNDYLGKISGLKAKTAGKLIVKEYPMATAGVAHFRNFINELKLKQNFTPDIIYVDYLNLCTSARLKGNSNASSYTYMKAVSEELRGLASEVDVPIVTATQFNRGGMDNTDPGLTDISESVAVTFGVDFLAGLIANDDMKARGQVLVKQYKNRYSSADRMPKFFIGFDRDKMQFYNIENPTEGIVDEMEAFKKGEKKSDTSEKTKGWDFG